MDNVKHIFAKNRAEESSSGGPDNWKSYILPPFFNELEVNVQKKPVVIRGGRGCGKTSLLRYLSHHSQLSPDRNVPYDEKIPVIGLYYRADTQFLRTFTGSGVETDTWEKVFEHGLCLAICSELLDCVRRVIERFSENAQSGRGSALDIPCVLDFDDSLPTELNKLIAAIRSRSNKLSVWTNNVDTPRPRLLPLKSFILSLINDISKQLPQLRGTRFNVYIDEYENMLEYQRRFINTMLKHSVEPLVFNIAVKRNALEMLGTVGSESLQEVEDYRTIDLEEKLSKDFDLFCAELFLFRLQEEVGCKTPVNPDDLRAPEKVDFRRNDTSYRQTVLTAVKKLFPGNSTKDIASQILKDKTLRNRLLKLIAGPIDCSGKQVASELFVDEKHPEASIVNVALLHQQNKTVDSVLKAFRSLQEGSENKYKHWIHTFVRGTLYLIYLPLQRVCPLYSGFESMIQLASGNIRHFLELAHRCWIRSDANANDLDLENFEVSVDKQLVAVKETSALYFEEIKGAGELGNRLFELTRALGQIFRASQARLSQSESERTHFSIKDGQLSDNSRRLLREAVKWSVLFETAETKVKDVRIQSSEYQLNPIYAAYFGISYRKGRKLELAAQQFEQLQTEKADDVIKSYQKLWGGDVGEKMLF